MKKDLNVLTFRQFIVERKVDPNELAQRAARRYGKRTSYSKWEKVKKGGHIPLTSYDSRKVRAAAEREMKISSQIGINRFKDMFKSRTMEISNLKASQPFVRTDDLHRLKEKIKDTHPTNVRVVGYKGRDYIYDGHHSVMAAKLRGDKNIAVKYIDLDQFSKK